MASSPSLPAVDIIIPVFNGSQWLKRCVESVLGRTQNIDYRIMFIDDCSTDIETVHMLESFEHTHPERILLLRNTENLGFVLSVNRGMRFSRNDVVLLNIDTEVTPGWLSTLADTAHSSPNIASVTPLSNEASIYSLFQSPGERAWFKKMGSNASARLLRVLSERRRPEIPVGVGFCMYMRRDAINAVGYFDTVFGRGYGEENDWCLRASACGWRHLLEDTVFVAHEGHVVMRATGDLLPGQTTIQAHENILDQRYPEFRQHVAAFQKKDRVLPALRNRMRNLLRPQTLDRLSIAYILHNAPRADAFGGTQLHVWDLITELRSSADILVMYPVSGNLCVHRYIGDWEEVWTVPVERSDAMSAAAGDVLAQHPRDVVHVHHTMGFSFAILTIAKQSGARVLYSVHDYYALSSEPTLTDRNGSYHGVASWWKRCPGMRCRHGQWRNAAKKALASVDVIIAPSESALSLFDSVFSSVGGMRRIIPNGVMHMSGTCIDGRKDGPVVCFLGCTHAVHKGRFLVEQVLQELMQRGIRCVVLGADANAFAKFHSPLVSCMGRYRRSDLPNIFKSMNPHLVAILSTYPETFCFALSESWKAGIPAYVTPMGALKERMESTGAGRIASSWNPVAIAEEIAAYIGSEEYRQAIFNARNVLHKSVSDVAQEFARLYDVLREERFPSTHRLCNVSGHPSSSPFAEKHMCKVS